MARRDRYTESPTIQASVIGQSGNVALIDPVYYRNTENRYATVAVRDFVANRTPFEAVELNPLTAQANRQNAMRGIAPEYPDNVDYVISSTIINNQSTRQANPNYKASTSRESNFGKQLLNTLSSRSFPYYLVSNVDVEVAILMPKSNQQVSHIERVQYKVPLTENVNEQQLIADAPVTASVDALQAAMLKYELPVFPEAEQQEEPQPKKPSLFDNLIKSTLNQ
jgi:hypothetical protein